MRTNKRHIVTHVVVTAASVALQACAATIGPYAPQRASITNRSMTSRDDVLRQQSGSHRLNVVSQPPVSHHVYWSLRVQF